MQKLGNTGNKSNMVVKQHFDPLLDIKKQKLAWTISSETTSEFSNDKEVKLDALSFRQQNTVG